MSVCAVGSAAIGLKTANSKSAGFCIIYPVVKQGAVLILGEKRLL